MGNNSTGFRSVRAGLGASLRLDHNQRYVYTQFREKIIIGDNIGGATGEADANVDGITVGPYQFDIRWEQTMGGNSPRNSLDGLLIALDGTNNDGFELNLGRTLSEQDTVINTKSNGAFTIGTDAPFFIRVKLDIADVSDADQMAVGFSVGGYPADGLLNTYSDFAVYNVDAGNVQQESRLNSAGDVATDTTDNWADAGQHTLEVQVNEDGVVAMFYDGAVSTTEMATFTFDDGDVVHAFASCLLAANSDAVISFLEWESGFLSTRGLEFGVAPATFEVAQSYVGV